MRDFKGRERGRLCFFPAHPGAAPLRRQPSSGLAAAAAHKPDNGRAGVRLGPGSPRLHDYVGRIKVRNAGAAACDPAEHIYLPWIRKAAADAVDRHFQ